MIKLRPPIHTKVAKGVIDIDTSILQSSFVMLIVGKPGCGKSHLLRELILNEDLYYRKFNLILFITPSKFEDENITLDDQNCVPFLDLKWIFSKLNGYKDHVEKTDNLNRLTNINILIILDDVIGEIKSKEREPELIKLFYNRRHLLGEKFLISLIITTQKYVLCPPKVRSVLTSLIAFPLMRMDWRRVEEECIFDSIDKKFIHSVLEKRRNEPFVFIYIRLDTSQVFYKFERCLNII